MEETEELIKEIVEAERRIIGIDGDDIENTFRGGGEIHGLTVSVNPALDYRTEVLMDEVKSQAEVFKPYNHAIVFFFVPSDCPLMMGELRPLNEWFEEFPEEAIIKWGMALTPSDAPCTFKAVVLLQQNLSTMSCKESHSRKPLSDPLRRLS